MTFILEHWKYVPIKGLKFRYEASSFGRIRRGNNILMGNLCKKTGYRKVQLMIKGRTKSKTFLAHRIIALTWLPNPDNKLEVNHKDGLKFNNSVFNLEWVTRSENRQHAYDTGLQKAPKNKKGHENVRAVPIAQINKNGDILKKYGSVADAARDHNVFPQTICGNLRGKTKTVKKKTLRFKYL